MEASFGQSPPGNAHDFSDSHDFYSQEGGAGNESKGSRRSGQRLLHSQPLHLESNTLSFYSIMAGYCKRRTYDPRLPGRLLLLLLSLLGVSTSFLLTVVLGSALLSRFRGCFGVLDVLE
jgi:hypothetical protein